MKMLPKLFLLVLALFAWECSALPSRVKRQGFNWGETDDSFSLSTDRTPRPIPSNPSPPPTNGGTTTTTAAPAFAACVRRCPTTPQYNPICGTNRVTYPNDSHLRCAVNCGLNVQKAFGGTCQAL